MSAPIPLFVELCAGTAALSLRLHRDGARPPVSRMGAKTGYADTILRVLGLMPGQRAAAYLWCEPDPGVRLLLHAYRDAGLARAAAAIIRSWAAEDPRALWERLRAEGPPRLPEGAVEAGEVARWSILRVRTMPQSHPGDAGDFLPMVAPSGTTRYRPDTPAPMLDRHGSMPATIAPDARLIDPREVARWASLAARTMPQNQATGVIENFNGGKAASMAGLAVGLHQLSMLPALIHPDARLIDPSEVARWAFVVGGSMMGDGSGIFSGNLIGWTGTDHGAGAKAPLSERLPRALSRVEDIPALIHPDARTIDPPTLPPGTVCYMDPPYVATTGYAHDLPRAEVVALARRWAAAGAIVAISEAEPIPELVAEGWHAVRIDAERVGNKRTFSKQQAEWLTLSQPPAWVPAVQASLFGGA